MNDNEPRHVETHRDGEWTFGTTYYGNTFHGSWCRFTGEGAVLRENIDWDTLCAENRVALADLLEATRQTSDYQAILKKWPFKGL